VFYPEELGKLQKLPKLCERAWKVSVLALKMAVNACERLSVVLLFFKLGAIIIIVNKGAQDRANQ